MEVYPIGPSGGGEIPLCPPVIPSMAFNTYAEGLKIASVCMQ
jgi:hypothetical protein